MRHMTTMLKTKDGSVHSRCAMTATEVVAHLAQLERWKLNGDDIAVVIEKSYTFAKNIVLAFACGLISGRSRPSSLHAY